MFRELTAFSFFFSVGSAQFSALFFPVNRAYTKNVRPKPSTRKPNGLEKAKARVNPNPHTMKERSRTPTFISMYLPLLFLRGKGLFWFAEQRYFSSNPKKFLNHDFAKMQRLHKRYLLLGVCWDSCRW